MIRISHSLHKQLAISMKSYQSKSVRQVQCFSNSSKRFNSQETSSKVSSSEQQKAFLKEYKIRSSLERLIYYYASKPLPKFSIKALYDQSRKLSEPFILQNARDTVEALLAYNARRLKEFRNLPYLVMLNPSISESYNMYLKSMSALLNASLNPPLTVKDNEEFQESTLNAFINIHADTLPGLSKGFGEVIHLISLEQIKQFLDVHLKERISMRLIVHQHIELSKALNNSAGYEKGGDFNGVIKNLNISEIVRKNAELVNDICLMKYDTAIPIKIDHNLYPTSYWSRRDPPLQLDEKTGDVFFPYIEYHLDYIFMELFKNAFRSHAENKIADPVQITISTSSNPSYLEVRIRDKGKGIPQNTLNHIFDYSFTTYESNEGEAYKTLNVPPGLGGNTVAGMGYGLPLSKNYVEIFNDTLHEHSDDGPSIKGSLSVQSYYGWGTDVYLKTVGV